MILLPDELAKRLICLACSSTDGFTEDDGGMTLKCISCGTQFKTMHIRKLHRQARDVVRFAYQYRRIYEHDLAQGLLDHRRYLVLEPPPWLVWCGLAALSGVIGNAAYDAVRALIRRIQTEHGRDADGSKSAIALESDDDVDIFLRYLREFKEQLSTADIRVEELCREEQMSDPLLMRHWMPGVHSGFSEKKIKSQIRETMANITSPESLQSVDWQGLFGINQISIGEKKDVTKEDR